jgi:hypothetical protein
MTALLEEDDFIPLRRLGRLEAESFDAALRERERREREERLTRLAAGDAASADPVTDVFRENAGTARRRQQDLERLAAFHRAVVQSRAWRLIQMARRLVGRAW